MGTAMQNMAESQKTTTATTTTKTQKEQNKTVSCIET